MLKYAEFFVFYFCIPRLRKFCEYETNKDFNAHIRNIYIFVLITRLVNLISLVSFLPKILGLYPLLGFSQQQKKRTFLQNLFVLCFHGNTALINSFKVALLNIFYT